MTPTSTPRPQISPSEGQEPILRPTVPMTRDELLRMFPRPVLTGSMIAGAALRVAREENRALRDSDQSPKGEDAEAASSRSDASAGPEGIAR